MIVSAIKQINELEIMDASKQTDTIIEILEENKASDITKIDVQHLTSTVDFMVIANGTSTRHIKALSEIVLRESKKIKITSIGVEGEDGSDWILIDFQDFLVHLMIPRIREFYNIEKLWQFNSMENKKISE
jgi:ribosome-associated protein